MVKLVRPGDTATFPTVDMFYDDANLAAGQPARYWYCQREIAGQPGCRVMIQFYDGLGNLIQTKQESAEATQMIVSDTRFDAVGRTVASSQPRYINDGSANFWNYVPPGTFYRPTTTSYDALDRALVVTAPDGTTTTNQYGVRNDGNGLRTWHEQTDARGHRTAWWSDTYGRLRTVDECGINCASPARSRYDYDQLDRLTLVTNALGHQTSMTYNSRGDKLSMTDPQMGTWTYGYHHDGQLFWQIDPRGLSTYFDYDVLNRTTRMSPGYRVIDLFNNQGGHFLWNSGQSLVNNGGNMALRSVNNAGNNSFERTVAAIEHGGRVTLHMRATSSGDTQAQVSLQNSNPNVRFGVRMRGNQIEAVWNTGDGVWRTQTLLGSISVNTWYAIELHADDGSGFRATVSERDNGNVWGTHQVAMPTGLMWRFQHWIANGSAELDMFIESVGDESHYYYDNANRKAIGKRWQACTLDYHWVCRTNQDWEYDVDGEAIFARQVTTGVEHQLWTAYDSAGRVHHEENVFLGDRVNYYYDAGWRPWSATSTKAGGLFADNATYNALNQPLSMTLGANIVRTQTYSGPMERLSQLQITSAGTPLVSRSYSYDQNGNITQIGDGVAGNPFGQQNFVYDHRDRLTTWWRNSWSQAQSYNYDVLGNLTSKNGTSYSYTSLGGGRPYMLTNVGGSAYTYDAAGNLLSGGGRQYSWNHFNKPSRIRGADGVTEYYRYDPDGNRSERIRGAQRIIYTPDGAEIEGNVRRITHRFNGQPVLQRTYTGTTLTASTYLHSDHLGSVAASSDGSGGALQRQWFDPWGAMWSGGVNATTRNYTGQHRDGTGLLFYNARYDDLSSIEFLYITLFDPLGTTRSQCLKSL